MKHLKSSTYTVILSLSVIFLFTAFSGCVSKKKYEEALQTIASYKVENDFQGYDKADTLYSQSNIYYAQMDTIRALRREIDSLELVLKRVKN